MNLGRINFGPAATPTFPEDDINRLRNLASYLTQLDTDRAELQESMDELIEDNAKLIAEVKRLTQLLNGK